MSRRPRYRLAFSAVAALFAATGETTWISHQSGDERRTEVEMTFGGREH